MVRPIDSKKTGSWTVLVAMGIAIAFGTLSPASIDVKAENSPTPFINGLMNPSFAGLSLSAREVPEKRTEKAAVFRVGHDTYTAVSFGVPLFTEVNGKWMPIEETGREEVSTYVFDRLAEGVDISFDLTKPQYTLTQNNLGFTVAFAGNGQGRIVDGKSVEYILAEGATLRWTVEGNHVRKEILVEKKGIAQDIAFTIKPIGGGLTLKNIDEQLEVADAQGGVIFTFDAPFLAREDGTKLDNAITLKKSGNAYRYMFDESALALPYVIDPSSGPNSPGTIADDSTVAGNAWSNVNNATASDNAYATAVLDTFGVATTHYLKATNFGFSIPAGATINGVVAAVEGKVTDVDGVDQSIKLVKGGTIQGNEKARSSPSYYWAFSDTVMSFGASNDVWGLTLTDTDINASNFGFVVSLAVDGGGVGTASVDQMTLTIHYTAAAGGGGSPVPALSFTSGSITFACYLWSRHRKSKNRS